VAWRTFEGFEEGHRTTREVPTVFSPPLVPPSLEVRGKRKKRDFSLNATAAGAAFLVGLAFVSARISRRPRNPRRTRPPEAYRTFGPETPATSRKRRSQNGLRRTSAQKVTGSVEHVAHLQPPLGYRVERSVPTALAAPNGRRWASRWPPRFV
jgi:hypothetical protein